MRKRSIKWMALGLALALLVGVLGLCVSAEGSNEIDGSTGGAGLTLTYTQCDPRWADIQVGRLNIAESACGIATVCNAVYYLTGAELDLVEVARWANGKGLYNAGIEGCYRSVFYESGVQYGKACGYRATGFQTGTIRSDELMAHLRAGGVAAVHVPGHFMTVVTYDEATARYLVIDPMPGDNGRYDTRRRGMTHTDGDWKTADQLSESFIAVDGYALFTRFLTDREREVILPAAAAASADAFARIR